MSVVQQHMLANVARQTKFVCLKTRETIIPPLPAHPWRSWFWRRSTKWFSYWNNIQISRFPCSHIHCITLSTYLVDISIFLNPVLSGWWQSANKTTLSLVVIHGDIAVLDNVVPSPVKWRWRKTVKSPVHVLTLQIPWSLLHQSCSAIWARDYGVSAKLCSLKVYLAT